MTGRFERFSERVRRVLLLANKEAIRLKHTNIGPEHILLGLVQETEGMGTKVLVSMGVDPSTVRFKVESMIGQGKRLFSGNNIPMNPQANKVIELAVDEARRMGHHYVGTEHLLIGLIREGEGVAAQVLENLGVTLEPTRKAVADLLSRPLEILSAQELVREAIKLVGQVQDPAHQQQIKRLAQVLDFLQRKIPR